MVGKYKVETWITESHDFDVYCSVCRWDMIFISNFEKFYKLTTTYRDVIRCFYKLFDIVYKCYGDVIKHLISCSILGNVLELIQKYSQVNNFTSHASYNLAPLFTSCHIKFNLRGGGKYDSRSISLSCDACEFY